MGNYAAHISEKVPQPQVVPARADQVENNAGGYVFKLDPWKTLDRFLMLGCDGGSYYASERTMTVDNAKCVSSLLASDPARVVNRIAEISDAGRAPKNDPALFALAIAAASPVVETRRLALAALPKVARIGTHLFTFIDYLDKLRGWSRGLRRTVASWYTSKPAKELAFQLAKYQSRAQQGCKPWSQRDVLRLCHAKTADAKANSALRWAVGKANAAEWTDDADLGYLAAHEAAKVATSAEQVVTLIRERGLVRESIPTQWLNDKVVWDAMLDKMPITAMVRNLGKMSLVGTLAPLSANVVKACGALRDKDQIRKSRLHPLAILTALKTYSQGHGMRGGNSWEVSQPVADALDDAFYLAFENVVPTGKRFLLGVDVSGSMSCGNVAGSPLTPREAAAAMAMTVARSEANYHVFGFSDTFVPLPITARTSLADACRITDGLPFRGTDCSLPMVYAMQKKLPVDVFVVITDNETYAGSIHPFQALREYRKATGINAKLVVIGMTATGFTIADPTDAGMLDVVGFDTATPQVIADFAADRI